MIRTDVYISLLSYSIVALSLRIARRQRVKPWCSSRDISRSDPVHVMCSSPKWSTL